MGLLDVLNGMRNGPSGQRGAGSSGGMSPITMAILALLAYKGIKHLGGGQQAPAPGGNPTNTGGGLGDLLKGGLGGLLAGGAAGGILSGGLGGLLKQFQQNGQGEVANTWVGKGANQDISETDLAKSIELDLEKNDQNVLSLDLLKKLDEVDKLTKRILGRVKK